MGRKYSDPPWVFTGRALYQLQLVKVDQARRYVPRDLDIVSLFGYTLGGFYLARYDDSPAGAFDECVALAGIVWNKPTSCAWAARVFVNNREARDHGRQHVGLPSRVCQFYEVPGQGATLPSWWDEPLRKQSDEERTASSTAATSSAPDSAAGNSVVLRNTEKRPPWRPWGRSGRDEGLKSPVCAFAGFPSATGRKGPRIKLSLPSYAGRTHDCPGMLRYACHLRTNVRLVSPLAVSCSGGEGGNPNNMEELSPILNGRPVLALAFDSMEMVVQKPISVVGKSVTTSDEWELTSTRSVPRLVTT